MRGQAHGIVWRKKPRVNIVNEADLAKAAKSLSEYFEQEKRASMGTLAGTLTEIDESVTEERGGELVGIAEEGVELARGIEPPTCGLQRPDPGNGSNAGSPPQSSEPDDPSKG